MQGLNLRKILITRDAIVYGEKEVDFFIENKYIVIDCERNGEKVIKSIIDEKPDVVIMDIIMYNQDGFEVLEKLHQSEIENLPKIILTSGVSNPIMTQKAIDNGADQYITKPFDIEKLNLQIMKSKNVC